jgi:hypothetical protein
LTSDPAYHRAEYQIKIERKKIYNCKKILFFDQKLQLLIPRGASAFQKRTSSTSKHEISELFSVLVGYFCPPGSGSTDLIESGSETLLLEAC